MAKNEFAPVTPGEMLRLNTNVLPVPRGAQERLGVIGGDLAGFPNGRRPGDDVVDIELRVAMGVLLSLDVAPSKDLPFTDGERKPLFSYSRIFGENFKFVRSGLFIDLISLQFFQQFG